MRKLRFLPPVLMLGLVLWVIPALCPKPPAESLEEYYTRQSWAYALNARTGEWDEVPINEPIANPEDYLDAEGKLYLQFRSDTQDQYVDIPTPGLLIEGKLSDGRQ